MILAVCGINFYLVDFIGYRVVALILLVTVSLIAMLFEIWPVILSAVLSALIWNFFFIPPIFTFHIEKAEDVLLFLMYFVIASVNAVLTNKIRKAEQKARDKEEKENTILLYNNVFNSLSHELRTPIATILGAVDTLKEDKISKENQAELLHEIDIASVRLNRQVENLLNINRLETGMLKLNLDWCDIDELIYAVIQKMEISSHVIKQEYNEKLPLFKLDSGLIEQVLYNLIMNATLYTPVLSQIKIKTNLHNDQLCIEISDTGNGFPEQDIPHMFEKFYRLSNTKAGGTGLGLSIVKGYVEAHQGSIILENCSPHGAKFTIVIPAEMSFINNIKNE